jgi:N-acetylmuramoyl-L-alanine amidase
MKRHSWGIAITLALCLLLPPLSAGAATPAKPSAKVPAKPTAAARPATPKTPAKPPAKTSPQKTAVQSPAGGSVEEGSRDSLDLATALARLDLRIAWNPVLDQAVLTRGQDFLVVQAGQSWAVLNGTRRIALSDRDLGLNNGRISLSAYDSLSQVFPPTTEKTREISTIFIDPGHGGKDPGAIGRFTIDGKATTLYEKDLALTVGLQLRDLLRARFPDKKIVMSRDTDVYLPLDERTRLANRYTQSHDKNTLFLSLHANASPNSKGKGFEVWYLPPEYRRQLIAEDDVQVSDKSVLPIINSIIEEEYTVESILLAKSLLTGMENSTGGSTVNRGMKPEVWYVVRSARMPSVLAELGFVSNPDEFALLRDPAYLRKLGEGIYNGLVSFIADYESVSAK